MTGAVVEEPVIFNDPESVKLLLNTTDWTALTVPFTSKVYDGVDVFIPTLPLPLTYIIL